MHTEQLTEINKTIGISVKSAKDGKEAALKKTPLPNQTKISIKKLDASQEKETHQFEIVVDLATMKGSDVIKAERMPDGLKLIPPFMLDCKSSLAFIMVMDKE